MNLEYIKQDTQMALLYIYVQSTNMCKKCKEKKNNNLLEYFLEV